MSVAVPARELQERRDRVARARLQIGEAGRADSKDRRAEVGERRPIAAASSVPPLPLEPTREEELAGHAAPASSARRRAPEPRPLTFAELQPAERAIAERLLRACAGAEVAPGFDLAGHVANVARSVAAARRCL